VRSSGICLHISSLPSPYGIGTLGKEAMRFVDFLKGARQSCWQVLPLGPTSFGDSPYQAFSTFAGNEYFIDPDILAEQGLLEKGQYEGVRWGTREDRVDYSALYTYRFGMLRKAHMRFSGVEHPGYLSFCEKEKVWLDNYALFMAIKRLHGDASWLSWPREYRDREKLIIEEFAEKHGSEVDFWKFTQYMFHLQWQNLRKYANKNGIRIIGDLPIYVAIDSADVWSRPDLFLLDDDMRPSVVSGVPPDAFSDDGQLWGNPVYDWAAHRKENYAWWQERLRRQADLCDMLRLDHFLGFETYYTVARGNTDAKKGVWNRGPGMELFQAVQKAAGDLALIAEDLGVVTEPVIALREALGLPGMRVLQFAFSDTDAEGDHMPYNVPEHCVVYAGTHDNPTIRGWWKDLDRKKKKFTLKYMGLSTGLHIVDRFLNLTMGTAANLSILCMQDLLSLPGESRMNHPGTDSGNWQWRLRPKQLSKKLMAKLAAKTAVYGRAPVVKSAKKKKEEPEAVQKETLQA